MKYKYPNPYENRYLNDDVLDFLVFDRIRVKDYFNKPFVYSNHTTPITVSLSAYLIMIVS
ncbi:hypothetical protein DOT_4894 [Desulfosporosinus sp. OT]|nr:hypothetical protein DOT_4894 [Desulfosporosinus sp. OT]